jgi:hypothetical protein
MNKLKWIIREIIYFPKFVFLVILAIIFGIFGYRKGLNKIRKNL